MTAKRRAVVGQQAGHDHFKQTLSPHELTLVESDELVSRSPFLLDVVDLLARLSLPLGPGDRLSQSRHVLFV